MSISSNIKEIRRKCFLTQTEFAKALGVSFSTVNRWENEKSTPNYQTLKKIKFFCDQHDISFVIDMN